MDRSSGRHRRAADEPVSGTEPDDIARALLGGPMVHNRREVSRQAEVSVRSARKLWHALGFPVVGTDAPAFAEADVHALRGVARMVRAELLDEATALAMTRALARSMDRLSIWQATLVAESLAGAELTRQGQDADGPRAVPAPETAREAATVLLAMADELEPLLLYVWRRHLTDALNRMIADSGDAAEADGVHRFVGFADLVSFTHLVRTLSEREVARVVQRFEMVASDVVTDRGGRVIKTVGDEVLFVAVTVEAASGIAVDLAEAMGADELLPDVRVGLASGPVVSRLGDVFGETVNRASRLTGIAAPGTVVVDEAVAEALRGDPAYVLRRRRRRALRGVGEVVPWVVSRATEPAEAPAAAPTRDEEGDQ